MSEMEIPVCGALVQWLLSATTVSLRARQLCDFCGRSAGVRGEALRAHSWAQNP